MTERLSTAALGSLPPEVARPTYDRTGIEVGIAHIGVGGFHRSHQAMYLDRLLEQGAARDWGICGIGLLDSDARMRDALTAQDGLYTLVLKHPDGARERRVIGSLVEYLHAPTDLEAVLERLADPAIRILTLTVTEGGYNVSRTDGSFDLTAPGVAADLAPGAVPRTVFGVVTAALARRRERGVPPFTVLSCDNLQGNGEVARTAFTTFASALDEELGSWMRESVRFPSSMVDRITPVTAEADIVENDDALGVHDAWPVIAEPFEQWAIEDDFPTGRPPWEQVGAQLVDDVEPYEHMKLRLLNSTHQAIAYLGYLAGHRYAHETMGDPRIVSLLRRYWTEEARPTLPPVPGVDLQEYTDTLEERYGNEHVRDTLARLCADSSNRIPPWLVPVVRDRLAQDGPVHCCAAVIAAWARYAEGVDEQGEPIAVVDALQDRVMAAARAQLPVEQGGTGDDLAFLRDRSLFGDLVDDDRFTTPYRQALSLLHARGATAVLDLLVRAPGQPPTAGTDAEQTPDPGPLDRPASDATGIQA